MATVQKKKADLYRITRYSTVWIVAALLLIPYELWMIVRGEPGGPLTHVVKWMYGEPFTPRWYMLGWASTGFIAWLIPHFLFEGFGLASLLLFVGFGLAIGLTGLIVIG